MECKAEKTFSEEHSNSYSGLINFNLKKEEIFPQRMFVAYLIEAALKPKDWWTFDLE